MFMIGHYNPPCVRRVAIALMLYDLAFEHRPWSTFGDSDRIAPYNPLRRVPTLVLDGGEALIASTAILGYLDEGAGPDKAMVAAGGPGRRRGFENFALGGGRGDNGGSLLFARALRDGAVQIWGQ